MTRGTLISIAGRRRFVLQCAIDAGTWVPALAAATYLRHEFALGEVDVSAVVVLGLLAGVFQVVAGIPLGLYRRRWRYGTLEEVVALGRTVLTVGVVLVLTNLVVFGHALPVSATAVAALLALALQATARLGWRLLRETAQRPRPEHAEPLIVFGAGDGAHQAVRALLSTPRSPFLPVAVLDDDPSLLGHRLKRDVAVVGDRSRLADVAQRTGARTLLVAIPSADGELLRELSSLADDAGLRTLVLPPVDRIFDARVQVSDIRPLTEVDLLGRRTIDTDLASVAGYLEGKRVLVTGAGGSIGSELVRQITEFAPASVVMLDRDESALHAVQLSLEGRALLQRDELVVGCIRDRDRLDEVFRTHRPEVIFHAAALKHLPLLELHPREGYKTNVEGTRNLLELAGRYRVERFVNISTDKAAEPTSVLGRSKRLAERLTAAAGERYEGIYLSVRFGNVLGSRGSVIPTFRAQIDQGGPVTVTHPEVARYFMTIEEACQLVVQAGAIGCDGEVLVLEMGEQVRILDVAKRLIASSERDVDVVFTGLRPGEKLRETLFGDDERPEATSHPLISRVPVPPLDLDALPGEERFLDPTAGVPIDLRRTVPLELDLRDETTANGNGHVDAHVAANGNGHLDAPVAANGNGHAERSADGNGHPTNGSDSTRARPHVDLTGDEAITPPRAGA